MLPREDKATATEGPEVDGRVAVVVEVLPAAVGAGAAVLPAKRIAAR